MFAPMSNRLLFGIVFIVNVVSLFVFIRTSTTRPATLKFGKNSQSERNSTTLLINSHNCSNDCSRTMFIHKNIEFFRFHTILYVCVLIRYLTTKNSSTMKSTDEMYDIVSNEATKVWGNGKMRDWYVKQIKRAVMINDTQFIAFENPGIETEFLFGYSDLGQGRSFDENHELMKNVREHVIEYFIEQNTRDIRNKLEKLRDDDVQFYKLIQYSGGVNEVCVNEVTYLTRDVETKTMLTPDERRRVIEAYEIELKQMTKRCHTWLKKYGSEKITLTSYWMDR